MQKISIAIGLILSVLLLTGSVLRAEVDVPWGMIHESAISKSIIELKEMLLPFGAQAGFPDTRPAGLENASYEELYKAAAARSKEGSQLYAEMIRKFHFPTRIELGAKYFMKRLEIGSQLYPEKTGNEKVFEFLCRDFAAACDLGFEELRFWGIAEGIYMFDNIWFKNIQEGFVPVKLKMLKAEVPQQVAPADAREIWKQAASALMAAGNEAGIASTKVGSMGFAAFPAWRLKYAIKYFKAASKAAVVDLWHSRNTDPNFWVKACDKLRQDITEINGEMDAFLAIMK